MRLPGERSQNFYLLMLAVVLLLIPVAALVRWVGWVH